MATIPTVETRYGEQVRCTGGAVIVAYSGRQAAAVTDAHGPRPYRTLRVAGRGARVFRLRQPASGQRSSAG